MGLSGARYPKTSYLSAYLSVSVKFDIWID
jgi:hypothetical protein